MTPDYYTKRYLRILLEKKLITHALYENIMREVHKDLHYTYKRAWYEGRGSK